MNDAIKDKFDIVVVSSHPNDYENSRNLLIKSDKLKIVFDLAEDEIVVKQFEKIFSNDKIVTVLSNEIALQGGILNCITWNIKK